MSGQNAFDEASLPLFEGDEALPGPVNGRLPSYIQNHRKRLRARFMSGGPAAMPD